MFLVINDNAQEGCMFDDENDANDAAFGVTHNPTSSLAEAFSELYPDGNRIEEIDIPPST